MATRPLPAKRNSDKSAGTRQGAPATLAANVVSPSQVRLRTEQRAAAAANKEAAHQLKAKNTRDHQKNIPRPSDRTGNKPPPVLDVVSQSEGTSVSNESLTENTNPTHMYRTDLTTKFLFTNHVKTKLFRKRSSLTEALI